jgi:hypothetical protein
MNGKRITENYTDVDIVRGLEAMNIVFADYNIYLIVDKYAGRILSPDREPCLIIS